MKILMFKIYQLIEVLLFIALFIFQIVYISNEIKLADKNNSLFTPIAIFHVSLTFISFLYAIYLYFATKKMSKIRSDLYCIYFLFALIADIFFSFTSLTFIGHIFFVLAYLLIMFIRKAKLYEYIGVLLVGIISIIIFIILNKLTPIIGIDCFLAPILIWNMIMGIINYKKEKNKKNLVFLLAVSLAFISDLSIGLSTLLNKNIYISNTFSFFVWPTYILACVLFNYNYKLAKEIF